MGLTITLERFATAVRETARRLLANPEVDGTTIQAPPVRASFRLGVETLRDELLAVADVGDFADLPDLEERARSFCYKHCSFSRNGVHPGTADACEACPIRYATVDRLVAATRDAMEG